MTTGPYASERDARDAAMKALAGTDALSVLTGACDAAGVELGRYDRITLDWLSQWEPATVAVVASLITRAHEAAGKPDPGTRTQWGVRSIDPRCGSRRARTQAWTCEEEAREAAREISELAPDHEPVVVHREIGPWKEAPDA